MPKGVYTRIPGTRPRHGGIDRECPTCSKTFPVRPYQLRKGHALFCSVACKMLATAIQNMRTCAACGKQFRARPDQLSTAHRIFCSAPCQLSAQAATRPPVADLFWSKVDKSGECWLWTGPVDKKGYGQFTSKRWHHRVSIASRTAWELTHGPIPEGMDTCHHCDNPPCVRPDHLFIGTRRDNMADMIRKGRAAHQH